jgi:isocitrate dehydrogenase
MDMADATIRWTKVDEAPALATYSLLPIVQAFLEGTGVHLEVRDISLAGRILATFPDQLSEDQKIPDELAFLGELAKKAEANIVKLPNISASIPQLEDALEELRAKGYELPEFPAEPRTDEEKALRARFSKVLGSAVNPVLREGNSDRRPSKAVKKFAQKKPHRMMKDWPDSGSQCRVAHMGGGDFFGTERSVTLEAETTAKIEFVAEDGTTTVKKEGIPLLAGEVLDCSLMNAGALREFFAAEIARAKEEGVLFSLHMKATMMKVSDPIIFGHCVEVFFAKLFEEHGEALAEVGANANNGFQDVLDKLERLPADTRAAAEATIAACYEDGPDLAMVDSRKGITCLHVPNNVIIDASMPNVVRDGGKMWNKDDALQDCVAVVPDRSYAGMYAAVVEDAKAKGQYDPSTMGNVANVGLMAKKAEEYGSHDKTFEADAKGAFRVVDADGNTLLEQAAEPGDIFRACQTKDIAIKDWVGLAIRRSRASGSPVVFWLDAERAHDAEIISKVKAYLPDHDTEGLTVEILAPAKAMEYTLERVRKGEDTISATGNVLRDYLTDLFPILELGTSARMLSIVPLLNGGGLFETGAGGSAPKHVQQMLKEGHLRWDSLGEYCALVPSLEQAAEFSGNQKAQVLADTLERAIGEYLENGRFPSRKVNEIDNRGSAFYLATYWAQALASQDADADLKARFEPVAKALAENEETIAGELLAAQGEAVDLGGYYKPDDDRAEAQMRPSKTFNEIIDGLKG